MFKRILPLFLLAPLLVVSCGKETLNPLYTRWQNADLRNELGKDAVVFFEKDTMGIEGVADLPGGKTTISARVPANIQGNTIQALKDKGKATTRNADGKISEHEIPALFLKLSPIPPGTKSTYEVKDGKLHLITEDGKRYIFEKA